MNNPSNRPLRILHIPTWYPNEDNPYEAIWLKRHIDALQAHCENEVYRLEVKCTTPILSDDQPSRLITN